MKNFENIGIAGDWHGNTGWAMNALRAFAREGITEVIHVGDFGIWPGADGATYIRKLNRLAKDCGITLYITPGNHEDYTRIAACPVEDDGWQHYRENILLAPRGFRWEWSGRSFVALGGANSIDRESRIEFLSWWADEQISLGDVYRTVENGHADIMITHDCPAGVNALPPSLSSTMWTEFGLNYARESTIMLRQAVDTVKPNILFHGHYHWFHDTRAVLNDGIENYETRVVGMDQDEHSNNIGTLRLADLNFTPLDWNG